MLPHQKTVLEIQRLRSIDQVPFARETVWLNSDQVPNFTRNDLEGHSLYRVLKEKYSLVPIYATQTIEPIKLNEYESQLLEIQPESLALLFRRTTYGEHDEIIEYTKCIYRTDTHKFEVLLKA
jgi:GntR family transcriptional regulator